MNDEEGKERKEDERHNDNTEGIKGNLGCVKEGTIVEGQIGKVRPGSFVIKQCAPHLESVFCV